MGFSVHVSLQLQLRILSKTSSRPLHKSISLVSILANICRIVSMKIIQFESCIDCFALARRFF